MNRAHANGVKEDFVKIDPNSIQEALRLFFQPTKTGDPRTDFYSAYQSETTEYDKRFVKQCDEYLNTSLIFAGLFSAVCAAFVIDRQQKLEPDPVAYLQAILQTLQNQTLQKSNSASEQVSSQPWPGPSSAQVTVSALLYASLSTSLLAAFLAMLGKHWLHRYTRHEGGSVSERCEDRQRKLDGMELWQFRIAVETPSVLLQFSLLLLVIGFLRLLWDIGHVISLVAIWSTAGVAVFYLVITCVGTFSYEFPFQTPPSLILRYFRSTLCPEPNRGAGCVLWTLNHITDPKVTVAALGHLVNIRWHHETPKRVPLPQVAKIYTKCFDTNNHIVSGSKEMTHMAGRALIQLHVHRMCSGGNPNRDPPIVTDALNRLRTDGQLDQDLQRLSPIVKSIWKPDQGSGYRWEMMNFDLPWISELWVYHVWFRRTKIQSGIVAEQSFLGTVTMLFSQNKSPSPAVFQNILHGILAGVSLDALPLDKLLDLQRDESAKDLFKRLRGEMKKLVDNDLQTLCVTLEALVSWEHGLIELTILCCVLLLRVMDLGAEPVLARKVICLLCQIAFRHPIPDVKTRADLLDPGTLKKLLSDGHGGVKVDNDLVSSFVSVPWSDGSKRCILETILGRKPAPVLSPSSHTTIITTLGTAQLSLVEKLDRGALANFVRGLPTDAIQQMVKDTRVGLGWVKLLLLFTFPVIPPPKTDTRPFWKALRSTFRHARHFFSPDLPNHLDPPEKLWLNLSDTPLPEPSDAPPSDPDESGSLETRRKSEEALWMKLFWSSRAFEEDDGELWLKFRGATDRLKKNTRLFQQLWKLCSSAETAGKRTKAYTEMTKLGGADLTSLPRTPYPPRVSPANPTRGQNIAGGGTQSLGLAMRDLPPGSSTYRRDGTVSPTTSSGSSPPDIRVSLPSTPGDTPPASPTRQLSSALLEDQDGSPLLIIPSRPSSLFRQSSTTTLGDTPPASPMRQPNSTPFQGQDNTSLFAISSRPSSLFRQPSMTTLGDTPPTSPMRTRNSSLSQGQGSLPLLTIPSGPSSLFRQSSMTAPGGTPPASPIRQQKSALFQSQGSPSPLTISSRPPSLFRRSSMTPPRDTPPASPTHRRNSTLSQVTTSRDTPPADFTTHQQNSTLPLGQGDIPPSTTSPEPSLTIPQALLPPSEGQPEPPTPMNDDGD